MRRRRGVWVEHLKLAQPLRGVLRGVLRGALRSVLRGFLRGVLRGVLRVLRVLFGIVEERAAAFAF